MHTDFRHALRHWRHRPMFAAIAVLILALGIGSTTSVFSLVDAVLLRTAPWPEAERLVAVYDVQPERSTNPAFAATWNRGRILWSAWQALDGSPAFDEVGTWTQERYIFGEARTEVVDGTHASSAFLRLLGARALRGRLFEANDDKTPSNDILISHELWQRHFGGSHDVIGRQVALVQMPESGSSKLVTVAGVLAPGFEHPGTPAHVFLPMGLYTYIGQFENRFLSAIGRLAPGVSIEAASAVAEPIVRGKDPRERRTGRLVALEEERLGGAAPPLWLLLGGAALLLLVACSNVAGLLLGEARARRHEIAVRTALGGSRIRLLRQLTIEHLMLASAGGVAGLLLARWMTPALVTLAPASLPGLDAVTISGRASALAVTLSVATALLFGIAPTASLASTRAAESLSEGGRRSTRRGIIGQRALVASELALALTLLVAAALFGETMMRLASRPLGFDPSNLAVVSTTVTYFPGMPLPKPHVASYENFMSHEPPPRAAGAPAPPRVNRDAAIENLMRARYASQSHTAGAIERLKAIPGVISVAGAGTAPFGGGWATMRVRAEGRPAEEDQIVQRQVVTEGYFETLRLPMLRGRDFRRSDRGSDPSAASVAVVSRELELRMFAGDAIGKRLLLQGSTAYEVVGVVATARHREYTDEELAAMYVLDRQYGQAGHLLVRTSGDVLPAIPMMREALKQYDARMVVTSMTTMEQLVARSVAEERFRAMLSSVFGGAALLLAAIGVYGLAARRVAERRHEIGVRMAIGAGPRDVRKLVLRDAWFMVGLGLLVGLPAAYGVSQISQSMLFGVTPTAPHVFALAAFVLSGAAILATLLPAHRATRIDPIAALRE